MRVGRVPLVPYCRPGSGEIRKLLQALARDHAAVLIANHGPVVSAPTLESAVFAGRGVGGNRQARGDHAGPENKFAHFATGGRAKLNFQVAVSDMRLGHSPQSGFAANISILFQERTFAGRFARAKAAGFDAVECWFPYDIRLPELSGLIAKSETQLIGLNTAPGDTAAGEWGSLRYRAVSRISKAFTTGARICGWHEGSQHSRDGRDDARQASSRRPPYLSRQPLPAAAGAAKHGLTVLIEPLNSIDRPGYFLRSSDQAAAIIDELKLPNLKLLFDVYHVQIAEGDILRRFDRHYEKIGHIQIAGVPSRAEPDDGELNYRVILREIARRNWNGWVGCEYKPRSMLCGRGLRPPCGRGFLRFDLVLLWLSSWSPYSLPIKRIITS